jgi:hypothetical protein
MIRAIKFLLQRTNTIHTKEALPHIRVTLIGSSMATAQESIDPFDHKHVRHLFGTRGASENTNGTYQCHCCNG